ncbi:hypothetical protein FACS1894101_2090 [Betaproteobacteria bacterium]|nr:hypothetical protein FACS1894101_2090 [Betaproteobacteria bacterium]
MNTGNDNKKTGRRTLNLGLQGGGAHGAYSWGVLDCLLEDGRFDFDGVSGTSAGAMNAVVLADGLMKGGKEGARQALAEFWRSIADSVPLDFSISVPSLSGEKQALLPTTKAMMSWMHYVSPYQLNPLNFNPLRKILKKIDFTGLRLDSPVRLFLAATNANTGKLRLFRTEEIDADAVLARRQQHAFALRLKIPGELADGSRLARAIHPGEHDDVRLMLRHIQRLFQRGKQFGERGSQRGLNGFRGLQFFFFGARFQIVQQKTGGFDADIGSEQQFFQRFEQLVIDLAARKQRLHPPAQLRPCAGKPAKQPFAPGYDRRRCGSRRYSRSFASLPLVL